MPLFRHPGPDDQEAGNAGQAQAAGPDYDAALRHFGALPLPQRAAELLQGISPALGTSASGMDQLLSPWCPVGRPGSRRTTHPGRTAGGRCGTSSWRRSRRC